MNLSIPDDSTSSRGGVIATVGSDGQITVYQLPAETSYQAETLRTAPDPVVTPAQELDGALSTIQTALGYLQTA